MAFKELDEFFDPTLRLPIRGKVYVVPSPDAKTGLWCQRMLATGELAAAGVELSPEDIEALNLDDGQEKELYRTVLGTAWDELFADGVPWEMVKHAGKTAFIWIASTREAAEACWNSAEGDSEETLGESRRPTPQDHKAPARTRSARRGSRDSSNQTPQQPELPQTDSQPRSGATGD